MRSTEFEKAESNLANGEPNETKGRFWGFVAVAVVVIDVWNFSVAFVFVFILEMCLRKASTKDH